jgi:hypothetical protein
MIHRTRTTAAIAAIVAAAAGTASAQFWTNAIGSGLTEGISDDGVATGQFNTPNGQYFVWQAGGATQYIGGVSAGDGVGGQAKISNDGRYISGTIFNAAQNYHEMARYDRTTGTWTGFGALPGIGTQIDAEVSSGWAVSGDGQTVAGLGWTTQGTADAYASVWRQSTGLVSLGTNAVGNSTRANALSNDGSVVGGWQDGNGRQGAVWVNGVQQLIFDNDGNAASEVLALSGDGQWATGIGFGGFFGPPAQAYRYNTVTQVYENIPNLDVGGESRMTGSAITDDGSLIVGGTWGFGPATFGTALVWEEGVGTMRFDDYLDSMGIAYDPSFEFAFITDVSGDGTWFTGWGNFGDLGSTTSFIVRVPTPGAAGVLAMAGLIGLRRRR